MATYTAVAGARPQWVQIPLRSRARSCVPHVRAYGVGTGLVSGFLSGFLLGITGDEGSGMRDGQASKKASPQSPIPPSPIPHPASPYIPQILPQLLPRAVDVGLNSPQRELHDFGDFVVRVILDVAKDDAGSVLRSELGDRLLDLASQLARLELLERGFSATRHRYSGRPRTLGGDRVRSAFNAHGVDVFSPEIIDGDVVGDLEQPTRKFELGPVTIDVVEDLDEGLLRQVFGGLAIAHHPVDKREHRALVPFD